SGSNFEGTVVPREGSAPQPPRPECAPRARGLTSRTGADRTRGGQHMAVTFADTIKPYFTPCYRAHMLAQGAFDLWELNDVKSNWQDIFDRCNIPAGSPGSMPAP